MSERLTRFFASRWGVIIAGAVIGVQFLKSSYNLGRSSATYIAVGWVIPAVMVGMLLLHIFAPQVSENGATFFSESGPGAMYAPLLISLGAGLIIGLFAQRTRFCTMGSVRDVILMGDTHLISGLVALVAVAFGMSLLPGQFNFGLLGQPVAHSQHLWNFLGMTLVGLAFALAGGCPGRQLFLLIFVPIMRRFALDPSVFQRLSARLSMRASIIWRAGRRRGCVRAGHDHRRGPRP